jgi:DNA invertase Pin-like site-specific DNA recombinase
METSRRAALYVRVSASDRGHTVENQLQPLQEADERLGWTVVAICRDEGISGSKGRDRRPGLDALLKGVTRREFNVVADWSVCWEDRCRTRRAIYRPSASTSICIGRRSITARHRAGCCSGCRGCSASSMIRDRVMAGLGRARSSGKRLGRPRTTPFQVQRIRLALEESRGLQETARLLKVSAAKVSEVRRMWATVGLSTD